MSVLPLLLAGLIAPAPLPVQDQPAQEAQLTRTLTAMDTMVAEGDSLGLVAIVTRGDETLLEHACGLRDSASQEPMKMDTIFRIYSMTKPITAVAALTFFDEGRFGLDDPIARYLPELAHLKVVGEEGEDQVEAQPVLVRDLFRHTTGWSYKTPWGPASRAGGNADPDLEAHVKALANLPLEFQPGTRWRYGISIDVLGRLVEVLAEDTLDNVFRERIFEPLGMADTGFAVPTAKSSRLAQLSIRVDGELVPSPRGNNAPSGSAPAFLSGGGGLYSTLADYLLFLQMMRAGGALGETRILKAETVALMTRDHLGDRPSEAWLAGRGFGLGVAVITESNRLMGTPDTWSWGGAAGTSFWVDPRKDVIAVFMNQTWMEMGPRIRFQFAVSADLARLDLSKER